MAAPTPAELTLVNQVFAIADPQKLGIVTGETALKVFAGTKLSGTTLGEVWGIADSDNNGFLTKKDLVVALRLIGHAQRGEKVSTDLVNKPGPLATIEGISRPSSGGGAASTLSGAGSSSIVNPTLLPLTAADKTKYLRIFVNSGPSNGLLAGDKARDILLKSKLPYEKLSQIWSLADTHNRGSLDSTDFAIAMYFVQACMSNPTFVLPTTLPPTIYEQAGGKPSSVISHATGGSGHGGHPSSPLSSSFVIPSQPPVKPQYTGGALNSLSPQLTGQSLLPLGLQRSSAPQANRTSIFATSPLIQTVIPWDVSPQEKTTYDGFYGTLDTTNRGFIEGDVAVPFLLQSGLPEDILAQIWDLADIQKDGKLTKDGFAVAMHLINGKLAGKPVPTQLPESLIPPSMRQPATSGIRAAAPLSQIHRDLLDDNSPPGSPNIAESASRNLYSSPNIPVLQPQSTGLSSPPTVPAVPIFQAPPIPARQPPPAQAPPPPQRIPESLQDLLGEDDDTAAENAAIHANAVEIGNLNNQISSTQRSLKSTQEERKTLESTVAAQASQLSALQSQLATATAAYETEKKLLATLQERMAAQNTEIQTTREALIHTESDVSAVRLEKAEIEGSVLRDKEEIRELQRRMKEATTASEALKAEVEKLKKDARQQKGLLAIAKKQLTSSEADREKAIKELEEAKLELEQAQREIEETEARVLSNNKAAEATRSEIIASRVASPAPAEVAAAVHIPETPDLKRSASSISGKSTNPFDKLNKGSVSSSPKAESPFLPFAALATSPQEAPAQPKAHEDLDDPFGFGQESQEVSSPTGQPNGQTVSLFDSQFGDLSVTPVKAEIEKIPGSDTLDEVKDKFPDLDSPPSSMPGALTSPPKQTEDFAPIKDLEPEEEESDSSDDDEEVYHSANATGKDLFTDGPSAKASTEATSTTTNGHAAHAATPPGMSAFDDAFAAPSEAVVPKDPFPNTSFSPPAAHPFDLSPPVIVPDTTPKAALFEPVVPQPAPQSAFGIVADKITPVPTGASAFDEAMGIIPAAKPAGTELKFESNFDDAFDFGGTSSTEAKLPAPVTGLPPPSSTAFPLPVTAQPPAASTSFSGLPQLATTGSFSFEDAFGGATQAKPPQSDPGINGHTLMSAFDDVFTPVVETPVALAAATPAVAPVPPPSAAPGDTSRDRSTEESARVSSPRPSSPPTSPNRTISSNRSNTPPPRASSPAYAASAASRRKSMSSKAVHPEEKKSKISLRFPFSRKNKDKEKEAAKHKEVEKTNRHTTVGLPSTDVLVNALAESSGSRTPALEDDAESLKNLCQMGFSRSQALAALEEQNFDMQKALNSLLGMRAERQ